VRRQLFCSQFGYKTKFLSYNSDNGKSSSLDQSLKGEDLNQTVRMAFVKHLLRVFNQKRNNQLLLSIALNILDEKYCFRIRIAVKNSSNNITP